MGAVIANLVNHPERGTPSTDDNREQLIRYIWLDEGCPEGRADAHWQMATELVAAEEGRVGLAPKPSANVTQPRAAKIRAPSKQRERKRDGDPG
jgi:hypothetical protein